MSKILDRDSNSKDTCKDTGKDTFISNGFDSVLIPDEHLDENESNSLFNSGIHTLSGIHTPKESLEAFCLKNNIGKLFHNI